MRGAGHIAGTASALGAMIQTLTSALFAWLGGLAYDGSPAAIGYCLLLAAGTSLFLFRWRGRAALAGH